MLALISRDIFYKFCLYNVIEFRLTRTKYVKSFCVEEDRSKTLTMMVEWPTSLVLPEGMELAMFIMNRVPLPIWVTTGAWVGLAVAG